MTSRVYFISDIHFGAEPEEKEENKRKLLKYFLEEIQKDSDQLYIIGDLFDFWFEYKHVVMNEHHEVVEMLYNAIKNGLQIHYIAGNHDFWLGDFLEKTVGIHIYPDPVYVDIDSKRFYLNHGDGIAKRDRGYRLMKRVFRFKPNIKMYRWLHPDIGIPLAKFISGSSRKYTNNIDLKDHDDYINFAENMMNEGQADFCLMGHRHNPLKHQFENGNTYINTGDWLYNFSYAYFENGNIHLKDLKDKMDELKKEQEGKKQ